MTKKLPPDRGAYGGLPLVLRPRQLLKEPYFIGLALVIIWGLAVVFRLSDLGGRDLWTDEAWVALAALKASPKEALAAGQSTPPFYVLTVWAAAKLWGGSEAVLRSLSFLFGLGTLLLSWRLARSLMSLPSSLVALAALAVSPVMVYYAKELKQYSGDAFFAVLVFYLAERCRSRSGWRAWLALMLAGVVGLGFSHAQVFILPVAGAALALARPRGWRPRVALLGSVWALAFAAAYFLFFRRGVDPELVGYWTQDFPDFSGWGPFLLWVGSALYRYFWYFLGEWGAWWGPPLLAAGIVVLGRRGRGRAVLYLLGPLLLAFAAASLHRYPFMAHYGGNRLMLFSAPLLYLVVAAGLCATFAWLWQRRLRWAALALTGLLLFALHPLNNLRENLRPLNNREELQPLVAQLEKQIQPQDLVYVHYFAVDPFKYYYHGPEGRICWGKSCGETGLETAAAGDRPRRIWLIASHILSKEDMRQFAAQLLGPHWCETACFSREGAVLFRFEHPAAALAAKTRPHPPAPPESAALTPPDEKVYK